MNITHQIKAKQSIVCLFNKKTSKHVFSYDNKTSEKRFFVLTNEHLFIYFSLFLSK
jgi:hypothetical protein